MWLSDGQSASCAPLTVPPARADPRPRGRGRTEIGVALTTFGALFMMLGVVLFFDGALLALGNVRPFPPRRLRRAAWLI